MDCLLFRHGIAVERDEWDGEDATRPLTSKGVGKVREAAAGLRALDAVPSVLLVSPLIRAVETARLIREVLRLKPEVKVCDELRPEAPPDKLLGLLASFPETACVLCVGHEPHLGEVAGFMLFSQAAPALSLKKAGACCIRFEGSPKAGKGTLAWWMGPGPLRKLGRH
ncbi:SixA phosphatase family protein [Nitrospira sp. Kam-Ns4a]